MTFSEAILPSNRNFGLFFTAIFLAFLIYFFVNDKEIEGLITGLSALIIFIITLTKPQLLLPFNKLWMSIGYFMGIIIGPVVLGIIFFSLFTPYGVIMRLYGRDELRLKRKKRSSYWIHRDNTSSQTNFDQQF